MQHNVANISTISNVYDIQYYPVSMSLSDPCLFIYSVLASVPLRTEV